MTGNLQFRRGLKTNLPTSAPSGMPLWCEDTQELFIGTGTSVKNIISNNNGQGSSTDESLAKTYEKINKPILYPELVKIPLTTLLPELPPDITDMVDCYVLTDNSIHRIEIFSTCTFLLPQITDNNTFHQIFVQIKFDTPQSITLNCNNYFNDEAPDLSKAGTYNLIYEHDGSKWVVGCIRKV